MCRTDARRFRRPLYVRGKTVASRSDRIRIAYLSADFHSHATAYLMAGVFEQHDRGRFEIYAVSLRIQRWQSDARAGGKGLRALHRPSIFA